MPRQSTQLAQPRSFRLGDGRMTLFEYDAVRHKCLAREMSPLNGLVEVIGVEFYLRDYGPKLRNGILRV